jgi:hypothetical protein
VGAAGASKPVGLASGRGGRQRRRRPPEPREEVAAGAVCPAWVGWGIGWAARRRRKDDEERERR